MTDAEIDARDAQLTADVAEWEKLTAWLAIGKEREMNLRRSIAERTLRSMLTPQGTFPAKTCKDSVVIGGNIRKITVKGKLNYKVLPELIRPTCAKANLTAEEANKLLRVSYELSLTGYKALTPERRAIVDEMLSVTPGAIELSIE